ncbi:hypothetical protein HPP92_013684 [Vanilla planifolia]|uniref:Pentatricopeptide repeat-containing protein n=1 Tax=Vanilla planifolia TaxID=51239 RepID=A0A835UWX1_VANPL|nr:hypothetical protein HPP92_013684 [Vanilla planifolia]
MIGAYVQNACYEEALALFLQVLGSNKVVVDDVTLLTSLTAISLLQDGRLGRQVHAYLIKENSNRLPLILSNVVMVMYSRCNDVKSAFDIFCQMAERDAFTWNTMISAFVQNDLNFEGLILIYEMQKDGLVVDPVAVTALLSAASNLGNLRVGRETHGYLIRQGIEFEGMLSYLIDMYAKSCCVETAKRLFDIYECGERDQVTWNAMIAAYMHDEDQENSMLLFRKMLVENHLPNEVTISLILPACNTLGGIQVGKQIQAFAIRQILDTHVFVGTALVDMFAKCGAIELAEKVFDRMTEKNRVTYTTMILGFGQHGLGDRALSLLKQCSLLELSLME